MKEEWWLDEWQVTVIALEEIIKKKMKFWEITQKFIFEVPTK